MKTTQSINCLVGNQIRALREQKNISQEELGFRSDLHRAYIGQIERAERNITLKNLAKIAIGLEIDLQYLFSTITQCNV
jgi:transcriptional regulator with XRE-family HTH domain